MRQKPNWFAETIYEALEPFKKFFDNPATPDELFQKKLKEAENIINKLLIEFKNDGLNLTNNGQPVSEVGLQMIKQTHPFLPEPQRQVNIQLF